MTANFVLEDTNTLALALNGRRIGIITNNGGPSYNRFYLKDGPLNAAWTLEWTGATQIAPITLAACLSGKAQGYRCGTLQASALGHPVYLKMGFRDVCEFRDYTLDVP